MQGQTDIPVKRQTDGLADSWADGLLKPPRRRTNRQRCRGVSHTVSAGVGSNVTQNTKRQEKENLIRGCNPFSLSINISVDYILFINILDYY